VPLAEWRLEELMALERQAYPFPWTAGNFRDALRSGYSAWCLISAQDRILAYSVALRALDEAHLLNLTVAPDHQGQGLGAGMLEWTADNMRALGAQALLLEVRPSNLPALSLYQRFGFIEIGRRRAYYPAAGGREDAIVMRVGL
jgi:ribosomal-protein-alanine N-acetyltransferase